MIDAMFFDGVVAADLREARKRCREFYGIGRVRMFLKSITSGRGSELDVMMQFFVDEVAKEKRY